MPPVSAVNSCLINSIPAVVHGCWPSCWLYIVQVPQRLVPHHGLRVRAHPGRAAGLHSRRAILRRCCAHFRLRCSTEMCLSLYRFCVACSTSPVSFQGSCRQEGTETGSVQSCSQHARRRSVQLPKRLPLPDPCLSTSQTWTSCSRRRWPTSASGSRRRSTPTRPASTRNQRTSLRRCVAAALTF